MFVIVFHICKVSTALIGIPISAKVGVKCHVAIQCSSVSLIITVTKGIFRDVIALTVIDAANEGSIAVGAMAFRQLHMLIAPNDQHWLLNVFITT